MADKYKVIAPPSFSSSSSLLLIAEWLEKITRHFILQAGAIIKLRNGKLDLTRVSPRAQKQHANLLASISSLRQQADLIVREPGKVFLRHFKTGRVVREFVCLSARINPEIIRLLGMVGGRKASRCCILHQSVFEISVKENMTLLPGVKASDEEEKVELELEDGNGLVGKLVWKVYAIAD